MGSFKERLEERMRQSPVGTFNHPGTPDEYVMAGARAALLLMAEEIQQREGFWLAQKPREDIDTEPDVQDLLNEGRSLGCRESWGSLRSRAAELNT